MNGYTLYTNEPNTIHPRARVYTKSFYFDTNNEFKNRLVRIYLPSTYEFDNPHHRFKVIYMFDGKNVGDKALMLIPAVVAPFIGAALAAIVWKLFAGKKQEAQEAE